MWELNPPPHFSDCIDCISTGYNGSADMYVSIYILVTFTLQARSHSEKYLGRSYKEKKKTYIQEHSLHYILCERTPRFWQSVD